MPGISEMTTTAGPVLPRNTCGGDTVVGDLVRLEVVQGVSDVGHGCESSLQAVPRSFQGFGVQASAAPNRAAWITLARRAEDLGLSTLTAADHFDDQLASTPALMAAADATTTLRIGALVYANDYRHPVVLAKEAATLDLLSDGRPELGMGAGWMTTDYVKAGIALDPPGTRVDRLTEAVAVRRRAPRRRAGRVHRRALRDPRVARNSEARPTPPSPDPHRRGGRRVLSLVGERGRHRRAQLQPRPRADRRLGTWLYAIRL